MKTLVLALLCVVGNCSLLRTSQQQISIVGTAQALTRLFAQTFLRLTESMEMEMLSQLYPNNTLAVQIQLDTCESNLIDQTEDAFGLFEEDIMSFRLACEDKDPTAPMMKLMQDSMQTLANTAAPCDNLSVDLVGDIEKWIENALVSGATFASEWTGPLIQWNSQAVYSAFSSMEPYFGAVEDLGASMAVSIGLRNSSISQLRSDITQESNDWAEIFQVLSSGNLPSPTDLQTALNDAILISNDINAELKKAVEMGVETYGQAASAVCTFVTALGQAYH